MEDEVGQWISTKVAEQNFIPKFSRTDACETPEGVSFNSLAAGQETRQMGIQGIAEALSWAQGQGRIQAEDRQHIRELLAERQRLVSENEEIKAQMMKLAGDFQQVVKENETIRADANAQAVALTTEVETLKAKLAELTRDHPPVSPPKA
jgi:hypothetical protein